MNPGFATQAAARHGFGDHRPRANGKASDDGPFVDAKEFIGGFYLLEADNLDGATALAARVPAARMGGAVEVRPIVER